MKIERACLICGKQFYALSSRVKKGIGFLCSVACRSKYRSKEIQKICPICGREFMADFHDSQRGMAKYCSRKCYGESKQKKKIEIICAVCGKPFSVIPYFKDIRKTCSNKCLGEYYHINRHGDKCYQWKGGISTPNMMIRNSREYRQWRNKVFRRDHYTCRQCGIRSGVGIGSVTLHAHHIKSFSKNHDLRMDVENGITLCFDCHHKIHFRRAA